MIVMSTISHFAEYVGLYESCEISRPGRKWYLPRSTSCSFREWIKIEKRYGVRSTRGLSVSPVHPSNRGSLMAVKIPAEISAPLVESPRRQRSQAEKTTISIWILIELNIFNSKAATFNKF